MFSRFPRAAGGLAAPAWAILFTLLLPIGAAPAAAADVPQAADVPPAADLPPAATVDQFDLSLLDHSLSLDAGGVAAEVEPLTAGAQSSTAPAAVPVPLPPALGTGLVGLATMMVLRAGRRVYRRR